MRKILILFLLLAASAACYAPPPSSDRIRKESVRLCLIEDLQNQEFSFDNLVLYLHLKRVKEAETIMKQAIIETGWFRSDLFLTYNNLFGMKRAARRATTAIGTGFGHAAYGHWTSSVDDYLMWKTYWEGKGHGTADYLVFLESVGYSTSGGYIGMIKKLDLYKKWRQVNLASLSR